MKLTNRQAPASSSGPSTQSFIPDSFKSLVSENYVSYMPGIIKSVIVRDYTVFAIVQRGLNGEHSEYHEGLFNAKPYEAVDMHMTIPELAILTDIVPIGNDMNIYKGAPVLVRVENGIAVFASVLQAAPLLTTIKPTTIRAVRTLLQERGNTDIFSEVALKVWRSFGVVEEQVTALKEMVFNSEKHEDKTLTIEGEGVWGKDTDKQQSGETVLPYSSIFQGLNNQGMKSNDCHLPTRIFSAK